MTTIIDTAKAVANNRVTAAMRLDLIAARVDTLIDDIKREHPGAPTTDLELARSLLRGQRRMLRDVPLARLGPGGDFTQEIMAD